MTVRLLEDDSLQHIMPDRFPPVDFAVAVNADSLATWFAPVAWQLAGSTFRSKSSSMTRITR